MKWAFKIPKKRENVEVQDSSKDRATSRKFPVSIRYISGISEQPPKGVKIPESLHTTHLSTLLGSCWSVPRIRPRKKETMWGGVQ